LKIWGAKKKAQCQIYSVLERIYIARYSSDEGRNSYFIYIRIGKITYFIKHGKSQLCSKAHRSFSGKKLGGDR
jgi:hypothetical protein